MAAPLNVVSKAKPSPLRICSPICCNVSLPAWTAARPGRKRLSPVAMRPVLAKIGQFASFGRNSVTNVVLPAPVRAGDDENPLVRGHRLPERGDGDSGAGSLSAHPSP